jgi:hypothetical protein
MRRKSVYQKVISFKPSRFASLAKDCKAWRKLCKTKDKLGEREGGRLASGISLKCAAERRRRPESSDMFEENPCLGPKCSVQSQRIYGGPYLQGA